MSEKYAEGTCIATVGCRRQQAPGLLVCRGHLERLGAILREVEDEAAILSAVPSMQQRSGRGGSLASQRAPGRLDVLVLNDGRPNVLPYQKPPVGPACHHCWHETCQLIRNYDDAYNAGALANMSVLNTLHSWARIVREERRWTERDRATITGERDTLTRSLDWVAAQPWVDEFHASLTQLLGQLRAANGTAEDKPVGRCYLPSEDGQCGGPIWVDMAAGHAHCGRCRQTWDGPRLAMLNWELEQQRAEAARPRTGDGRKMLTAEELVAQDVVSSVSNVRVIAHRLGKVSVDGHYDPKWFERPTAEAG